MRCCAVWLGVLVFVLGFVQGCALRERGEAQESVRSKDAQVYDEVLRFLKRESGGKLGEAETQHLQEIAAHFDPETEGVSGFAVLRGFAHRFPAYFVDALEQGFPGRLPWTVRRGASRWSANIGPEELLDPGDYGAFELYLEKLPDEESRDRARLRLRLLLALGYWFEYLYNSARDPEHLRFVELAILKPGVRAIRHVDIGAAVVVSISVPVDRQASPETWSSLGTVAYLPEDSRFPFDSSIQRDDCDAHPGERCVYGEAYDAVFLAGPESQMGHRRAVPHVSAAESGSRYNVAFRYLLQTRPEPSCMLP